MSRACTACSRSDVTSINARLLTGTPIATVSREFDIHESSLSRHVRAHLAATVLRESRITAAAGTVDLLEAVVEALADVTAVRVAALATGNAALLLRAAQTTQGLALTLLDRLAPEGDTEVVRLLRDGERLARAVGNVSRQSPAIGHALARELHRLGDHETADALAGIAAVSSEVQETKGIQP